MLTLEVLEIIVKLVEFGAYEYPQFRFLVAAAAKILNGTSDYTSHAELSTEQWDAIKVNAVADCCGAGAGVVDGLIWSPQASRRRGRGGRGRGGGGADGGRGGRGAHNELGKGQRGGFVPGVTIAFPGLRKPEAASTAPAPASTAPALAAEPSPPGRGQSAEMKQNEGAAAAEVGSGGGGGGGRGRGRPTKALEPITDGASPVPPTTPAGATPAVAVPAADVSPSHRRTRDGTAAGGPEGAAPDAGRRQRRGRSADPERTPPHPRGAAREEGEKVPLVLPPISAGNEAPSRKERQGADSRGATTSHHSTASTNSGGSSNTSAPASVSCASRLRRACSKAAAAASTVDAGTERKAAIPHPKQRFKVDHRTKLVIDAKIALCNVVDTLFDIDEDMRLTDFVRRFSRGNFDAHKASLGAAVLDAFKGGVDRVVDVAVGVTKTVGRVADQVGQITDAAGLTSGSNDVNIEAAVLDAVQRKDSLSKSQLQEFYALFKGHYSLLLRLGQNELLLDVRTKTYLDLIPVLMDLSLYVALSWGVVLQNMIGLGRSQYHCSCRRGDCFLV